MKRADTLPLGDMMPHPQNMEVPLGRYVLKAEMYGPTADGHGFDNDKGIVFIKPNGVGEGRNTNRLSARRLAKLALQEGIDATVVTYDDGSYYDQESYTEAAVAVGEYVRERAVGKMIWVPHSRGGISLVDGRRELLALDAIDAVVGKANPYIKVGFQPDVRNLVGEVQGALQSVGRLDNLQVYGAFVSNICAQLVRPDSFYSMLYKIANTDSSIGWNELAKKADITLIQYTEDGIVPSQRNLAAIRDASMRNRFPGVWMELSGNHATDLLDPADAKATLEIIAPCELAEAA